MVLLYGLEFGIRFHLMKMDLLVKLENHQIRELDTGQTSILEVGYFVVCFFVKKVERVIPRLFFSLNQACSSVYQAVYINKQVD